MLNTSSKLLYQQGNFTDDTIEIIYEIKVLGSRRSRRFPLILDLIYANQRNLRDNLQANSLIVILLQEPFMK